VFLNSPKRCNPKRYIVLMISIIASYVFMATIPNGVSAHENGIQGKVIVVDAGHGGPDGGARGVLGLEEKQITLAVANQLSQLLREAGAIVIQTRDVDRDLATDEDRMKKKRHQGDLRGRLGVARRTTIDGFVSVHCNASPSPLWYGAHVLYFRDNAEGEELAKTMQAAFREHLLPTKRDIEPNESLFLLKRIKGPAVLAEIGFITNPVEAKALTTPEYQQKVAFTMYVSLLNYFENRDEATS